MPKFLAPHKSGPHRHAATTLYRALLRSTTSSPLAAPARTALTTLIKHRFRHNRHNASYRLLGPLFEHAYGVLDRLDLSRAGTEEAREEARTWLDGYLDKGENRNLLERIRVEGSEAWVAARGEEEERKRREAPRFERPGEGVWRRPLPLERLRARGEDADGGGEQGGEGKGEGRPRRKIPVLYSANKIPVLRFTKPQPRGLSLYLNSRIEQRQRRIDRAAGLGEMVALARLEDSWDEMMGEEHGVGIGEEQESGKVEEEEGDTWAGPYQRALEEVKGLLEQEAQKNIKRAKRYVALIDKEKACKEQERKDRVMERNRRALERKARKWNAEGVYDENQGRHLSRDAQ
ncbi:hypothetical protein B9Z65_2489 [Elsinoe australis]|uniref:Uncharacterized protein n=1 Tax=Elsinoe australis TaxID=40998 RepID=A0A2P7ZAV2_9PEZI|nr:hypothetical protein B9Z65_2489 [Elsinoe australis]